MIRLLWPQLDIMRILTVVESILLPMADPRVGNRLLRHGSMQMSLQRGGNCTWSRLPRRLVCDEGSTGLEGARSAARFGSPKPWPRPPTRHGKNPFCAPPRNARRESPATVRSAPGCHLYHAARFRGGRSARLTRLMASSDWIFLEMSMVVPCFFPDSS